MQTACQPPCGVLVSNSNCVYDILESFVRMLTTAAGGRTLSTSRVCLVQSLVCAGNAEEDSIKADVHYTCYVYAVYIKADVRTCYVYTACESVLFQIELHVCGFPAKSQIG